MFTLNPFLIHEHVGTINIKAKISVNSFLYKVAVINLLSYSLSLPPPLFAGPTSILPALILKTFWNRNLKKNVIYVIKCKL